MKVEADPAESFESVEDLEVGQRRIEEGKEVELNVQDLVFNDVAIHSIFRGHPVTLILLGIQSQLDLEDVSLEELQQRSRLSKPRIQLQRLSLQHTVDYEVARDLDVDQI